MNRIFERQLKFLVKLSGKLTIRVNLVAYAFQCSNMCISYSLLSFVDMKTINQNAL